MKKTTFLLFFLLFWIGAFAQPRSQQEAIAIANDFFGSGIDASQLSVVSNQKVKSQLLKRMPAPRNSAYQKSSFYVVNDETRKRFVIVSADERFYEILGYSNNGTFDPETAPDGLLEILSGYDAQYYYMLEHAPEAPKQSQRKKAFPVVEPLIKSKWGQSNPYWNWCPYDYDKTDRHPCVTGCVATALAQVMNFFKYPECGQGSLSYTTPFGTELAIDFDTVQFNWDKIQDTYVYYYDDEGKYQRAPERTAEENNEVEKLMKACGISVAMQYGTGGSYAYSPDLVAALVEFFKYNPNILYKSKDDFSADDWDDMIVKDLQAGHPILYSGNEGRSGHQFILDGCDANGLYHFNFGWSGYDDGYYTLTGTDGIDYNLGQAMVFQITPEEYGVHEDYCSTTFEIKKRKIALGGTCHFRLNLDYARPRVKTEAIPYSGEIGLALFDMDFNFIDSLYTKKNVAENQTIWIWNETVELDSPLLTNGKSYIIAPYSKSNDAKDPLLVRAKNGKQEYYVARIVNDTISFYPQGTEIPEIAGIYNVMAKDKDNNPKEWLVRLDYKDESSDYDFNVYNIDPAAANDEGKICESTASLSRMGTQLNLSKYIYSGNSSLINYTNHYKDLIVQIGSQNTNMTIAEEWGTINKTDSTELSRYHDTQIELMSPDVFNITVADNQAGELHAHLHDGIKPFITSLTITGTINGSDVKLIRELLTDGSLKHLNLEEAYIVEGGNPYYNDYRTQDNTIGDYMFSSCNYLFAIELPLHLKAIKSDAFYDCDNLNYLKLPEGIKEIPSYALSYCDKLSNLVIPSTVEIINNYCVSGSKSLRRIDCYIRTIEKVKPNTYSFAKPGDLRAFEDVPSDCEWHVAKGLKQKYMSQTWWKGSWMIIDDLPSTVIKGDANDDGEVDVTDVTSIISYIMLQPLGSFNSSASDMDDDGEVDVTDLTLVISTIMQPDVAQSRKTGDRVEENAEPGSLNLMRHEKGCAIYLFSPEDYVAAQFDIVLPEGVTIESVKLNSACHHQVVTEKMGEDRYRVLVFSMHNIPFENDGTEWLTINASSENDLTIENVKLTTTTLVKKKALVVEGQTTSVNSLQHVATASAFMLDGRSVSDTTKLSKGIYIINGKKFITK